jgi:hypothetical protein
MNRRTLSIMCAVTIVSLGLTASVVSADDDRRSDKQLSVSVAFGRGLNTAQPGNPVNHVVLPDNIRVKQDGVVHFLVAGFHQLSVYHPGKGPEDVAVPPPPPPGGNPFIDDPEKLFYQGINPAGGPLMTPETTNPSNAQNRIESISFAEPGTYLVICNVRGHFLDGMFGFVKVIEAEDDD